MRQFDRLGAGGGLAHDLHAVARHEQRGQPLPHHEVVVGNQDTDQFRHIFGSTRHPSYVQIILHPYGRPTTGK